MICICICICIHVPTLFFFFLFTAVRKDMKEEEGRAGWGLEI